VASQQSALLEQPELAVASQMAPAEPPTIVESDFAEAGPPVVEKALASPPSQALAERPRIAAMESDSVLVLEDPREKLDEDSVLAVQALSECCRRKRGPLSASEAFAGSDRLEKAWEMGGRVMCLKMYGKS
jgi:hypothetical protein